MDGPEVFKHAVTRMGDVTLEATQRAGLTLDDIDLYVYHQANARITRALGDRLGLPPERVVDCIETLGNASAATLPVALQVAERDGRLLPGSNVLLSGVRRRLHVGRRRRHLGSRTWLSGPAARW